MKVTKACNAGDHEDCQEAACECPCHLHDHDGSLVGGEGFSQGSPAPGQGSFGGPVVEDDGVFCDPECRDPQSACFCGTEDAEV